MARTSPGPWALSQGPQDRGSQGLCRVPKSKSQRESPLSLLIGPGTHVTQLHLSVGPDLTWKTDCVYFAPQIETFKLCRFKLRPCRNTTLPNGKPLSWDLKCMSWDSRSRQRACEGQHEDLHAVPQDHGHRHHSLSAVSLFAACHASMLFPPTFCDGLNCVPKGMCPKGALKSSSLVPVNVTSAVRSLFYGWN